MGYSAVRAPRFPIEVLRFAADGKRGLFWSSHKHQMEKRSMSYYVGLDVSVKETSVCIVNEAGKICRETKIPGYPEDLVRLLNDPALPATRIGLEAGPLSQWLLSGMAEAGLPVVCIETRHTKAYLKAQ